jgi:hypothetical protein
VLNINDIKDKKYELIFLLVFSLIFTKQITLSKYLRWEDEFDSVLTNKMLDNGLKLYEQIYNPHGPSPFILGIILEKINNFGIIDYRILVIILQLIVMALVVYSPIVKNTIDRLIILIIIQAILFMGMVDLFSQTFTYQNFAGLSLLVIITRLTIPIWVLKQQVSRPILILCSILLTNLFFLSFAYLPIIIILLYLSFPRKDKKLFVIGLSVPLAINTFFILIFGSLSGYLIQHFYVNLFILPKYYANHSIINFPENIYKSLGDHFLPITILTIIIILILKIKYQIKKLDLVIFVLGIISLLIRGVDFQALPFYYLWLGILIILIVQSTKILILRRVLLIFCTVLLIFLITSLRQEKISNNQIPEITDFGQLAEFFTDNDDKVFAYTYANSEYVLANRLPAISDFYYLPMQFDLYSKNQETINKVCNQLKEFPPKIGFFAKYDFSEVNPWDSYGKCVNDFINEFYYALTFPNLLVRKDLLMSSPNKSSEDLERKMAPSQKITKNSYHNLNIESFDKNMDFQINRIGILFATYQSKVDGNLRLVTQNTAGEVRTVIVDGEQISDNRYTFVDLKPDYYASFRIYVDEDFELSVWEMSGIDTTESCVVTKYTNGKFDLTHGCSPF